MNQTWYEKKRDEMYRAYNAALECDDMELAESIFKEYETYKRLSGGVAS
jgi:hypothetical protein